MNITNRQQVIFLNVIKHENLTLKQISDDLDLSERTITKEIERLNFFLNDYDTKIILKARNGISLTTIYQVSELINIINENRIIDVNRQFQLLVLMTTDYVKLSQLENHLLISRSSIDKLIKKYQVKLNLEKKSRIGIKSNLNEEQKIKIMASIVNIYIDNINYRSSLMRVLKQLDVNFDVSDMQVDLSPIIDLDVYTDESIKKYYVCQVLSNIFKVVGDFKNELRIRKLASLENLDDQSFKLIKIVNNAINNEITLANETLLALINHLNITLSQNQIFLQNEAYVLYKELNSFEQQYPLASQLAKRIVLEINEKLRRNLDEIESYFLALHLQSAMLKMEQNDSKSILIICEYGLGMSNFLSAKLELKIPHIKLIQSVSIGEYFKKYNQFANFDLIITTVINLEDKRDVMYVSPFLSDLEISKIENKLIESEQFRILNQLLDERLIKQIKVKNEQELVKQIVSDLKDYVSLDYEASLIKRMQKEVHVEDQMILPHANPKHVHTNKIAIYQLSEAIVINNCQVKLVVVNCFNTNFMHHNARFIRYYYRMLTNTQKVKLIKNARVNDLKAEIFEIIRS